MSYRHLRKFLIFDVRLLRGIRPDTDVYVALPITPLNLAYTL